MRVIRTEETCRTIRHGLEALQLVPTYADLALVVRDRHRCMGQHFFGVEDDARLTTGRAQPIDVALGGLLHLAGIDLEPSNLNGAPHTVLVGVPKGGLSSHAKMQAMTALLPWLTALGWEDGMPLAALSDAAQRLCPVAAWRRPNPDSFVG